LDILTPEERIQKMLSIIYQIPMGLIEADKDGNVMQINAKGVQLLLPLFIQEKLAPDNIIALLKRIAPEIIEKLFGYNQENGCIINQQHQPIVLKIGDEIQKKHYFFTINKLSFNSFILIFDDITELYENEQKLSQILQEKAIEQGKFEVASGVLHDIGNAVVGFGSYLTKIKRHTEQNDIVTLQNLKLFVEKQKVAIGTAIGEAKATAIGDLLNGIITNQQTSIAEVKKAVTEQLGIISHIQEILNIQRQYLRGQSTERAPVNLRSIINDSIAMLFASFDKKGIEITTDIPISVPLIKGDRTKLMQVILNLLKNSVESVYSSKSDIKSVNLTLVATDNTITITIKDTGMGFDGINGDRFFEKGVTFKAEGTGLGLANCKSIIESHHGIIQLHSEGEGKGATAVICFNI
jgi:nitrogen fixation/metabolism regulation signal transduction histidine kinase